MIDSTKILSKRQEIKSQYESLWSALDKIYNPLRDQLLPKFKDYRVFHKAIKNKLNRIPYYRVLLRQEREISKISQEHINQNKQYYADYHAKVMSENVCVADFYSTMNGLREGQDTFNLPRTALGFDWSFR